MKRYAVAINAASKEHLEALLPENYRIIHTFLGGSLPGRVSVEYVIKGEDAHGWTLDSYVIPRCASGNVYVSEIDLSHPIMKSVPVATRCPECGGPLEGWAGEHHSQQCSRAERDLASAPASAARLIWTKGALDKWAGGKPDPRHTISVPNVAEVYDGFVKQFRKGTPWVLVDENNLIIDTGTAGFTDWLMAERA